MRTSGKLRHVDSGAPRGRNSSCVQMCLFLGFTAYLADYLRERGRWEDQAGTLPAGYRSVEE